MVRYVFLRSKAGPELTKRNLGVCQDKKVENYCFKDSSRWSSVNRISAKKHVSTAIYVICAIREEDKRIVKLSKSS